METHWSFLGFLAVARPSVDPAPLPRLSFFDLVLNLPLVGVWAKMVQVPYHFLAPLVLGFSFLGAFSIRNNMFDVWVMVVFGAIGYIMRKLKYPMAPMVLGLILGPMLEQSFRQSLGMSGSSLSIFVTRPLSVGFLLLALVVLVASLVSHFRRHPAVGGETAA